MAFTVSAAVPSINNAAALKVYVVTGAAETGGNNAGVFANFGVPSATLTPAQSGSLLLLGLDGDATFTAEPNNTYDNTGTPHASENYANGHYTGTVTAGTGVTLGSSASVSGSACLAAYELVPSGTPAIDASTPTAASNTASPVTSASFTPPSGAVLAAVVMYDSTAANPTITVTDTSGLGLTWTKRVQFDGGGFAHGATIYTATVPGGGGAAVTPLLRPQWERPWKPALSKKFGPAFPFTLPPLAQPPITIQGSVSLSGAGTLTTTLVPFITGLAGTPGPGYFTDQNGLPRLWVATETWGLPVNAGNYSSPSYQHDYDTFFSERAAQGFTVVMTDPVWGESGQATAYNGNTWDSVTPLAGGSTDPSTAALNSTFWTRIDYMMTSAAANGITIGFVIQDTSDPGNSSDLMHSWTNTQWQAWATKVATRYASTPNLIWLVGNDGFDDGSGGSNTALWNAILAGLSAAGDTHLISAWYNAECTSRYVTDTNTSEYWGTTNAAFNFCYTYNAGYWIMEYAYLEVANNGAAHLLPSIWGDGFFYTGTSGSAYFAGDDRPMRQEWWWHLASGARGILGEAENVYPWPSGAAAAVTGDWFFANNAANIVSTYTGLSGWHTLIPDTSNALVTAGRGTRVSGLASGGGGGAYEGSFANSYVAASRTPDSGSGSSLAVLYLPNHTTITIDQTKMASGYTATWVDPITGATSSATTGSTYNSTAKGTNSQGDPDWVLILQASTAVTGSAGLSGLGTLSAAETIGTSAALAGLGTLTASPVLAGAASLSGLGTLTASAGAAASAALTGLGTLTAAETIGATASLSGAGTLTASPILVGSATFSGAGTLTASPILTGTASLSGTGTLTASPVLAGSASLSGVGTLTATAAGTGAATLSGLGTLTAAETLQITASLSGLGTLSVSSGAAATVTLSGLGSLTAAPVLAGTVTLAGLGTLTALPQVTGGGGATLIGLGTLTAAETLRMTAVLAGLGTLTIPPPFSVARSTATVTAAATSAASVTAAATSTPSVTDPRDGTAGVT